MNVCNDAYLEKMNRSAYRRFAERVFSSPVAPGVHFHANAVIKPPVHPSQDKDYDEHGPIFGRGGVYGEDGKHIPASAQSALNMRQRVAGGADLEGKPDFPFVGERVMYGNFFIKQWGHFLLDVVGRLWYALQDKDIRIVFTTWEGRELQIDGNYRDFLSMAGIDAARISIINEPTRFGEVVVPDPSIVPGSHYTREYESLMDTVVANAGKPEVQKGKKTYCTRRMLVKTGWTEFGEDTVESCFVRSGYRQVSMEKLPLREQIAELNSSEEIAMVCGSLSHNLLFARNANRVYVLNKTYRLNQHQFMINTIAKSKAVFVDAFVSPLPVLMGCGPFIMRPTDPFLAFARANGIAAEHVDQRIPLLLRLKYYNRYFELYKRHLLKGKKVRETDNKELEPSLGTVRAAYAAYLKRARKY